MSRNLSYRDAGFRDPELVSRLRQKPHVFLDALDELYGDDLEMTFSLKLFRGHLPYDLIETDLLPDTRVCPLVLIRSPIDTFISHEKFKLVGKANRVDTTDIRVRLSLDSYLVWRRRRDEWLKFIGKHRDRFIGVLEYEQLQHLSITDARIKLRDALRSAGFEFEPSNDQPAVLPLQDRGSNAQKKVTNFREFLKRCGDEGIDPNVDLERPTLPPLL